METFTIEKLTEFIKQKEIKGGYLFGLGAVSTVELAHYNLKKKKYCSRLLNAPLEIVSLAGNIGRKGEETVIHVHIAVSTKKMEVYGGHLKEAVVAATCEIILNEFQGMINREYSDEIGLNLVKLDGKR